jgi:hypothetical protein
VGGRSAPDRARRLVAAWLANTDIRALLRVNRWEGVDWFGREEWQDLLDWVVGLEELDGTPAGARTTRAVVERLRTQGDASAYRVDRLLELAAPPSRAARTGAPRPDPNGVRRAPGRGSTRGGRSR